jgi:hypothetical protein
MKHLEDTLQITCLRWFKLQHPHILIHHSPNGGRRNVREAARFKQMGTVAGFPDLHIAAPRKGFHGLYIELKAGKNKPTGSQISVMRTLQSEGYRCEVCYSFDEFTNVVNDYLKL